MKKALITGAAKRIGKELALNLADFGYDIILHFNNSAPEAEKVKEQIEKIGRKCQLIQADLSNMDQVKNLIKQTGKFDLLINNASIFERFSLMDTTEEIFDANFNINFKAPFFLTQHFAKTQQQGLVINFLDTYITDNSSPYFAYLLSKKALAEFTKMANSELAPKIRINGICPGMILPSSEFSLEQMLEKAKTLPDKKLPSIEDIWQNIKNILEDETIAGELLFVDGGRGKELGIKN